MKSGFAKTFALIVCFFSALPLLSQLSNATIQGTVTTSDGALLPNADVDLMNLDNGEHRTARSGSKGVYTFSALSPGHYQVKATAPSFATYEADLILRVGQNAEVNPSMKVGGVSTIITVADATPLINVANGTISDTKEATQIETLPLVNRNFLNILNFSPGVVANSFAGQGGGYTRVNGVTGGSATFFVDGQSVNDRFTNELQVTPQAVPTIQELKVTTSNGSAEYGSPGVIDVVTKGGTNEFHGQLYELYQTGGFQGKFFNNNNSNPHLVHNEFGGQIGGPVLIPKLYNGRNKTFFFFDAERLIEHSHANPAFGQYTVPQGSVSAHNWRTGDFSDIVDESGVVAKIYDPLTTRPDPAHPGHYLRDPFPGNIIPVSRINPIAKKAFALWPQPNVKNADGSCCVTYLSSGPTGGINFVDPQGQNITNITRYTGKVDQVIGRNTLSARYTYVDQPATGPHGTLLNPRITHNQGHNGTISFTEPIGSRAVNEFRVGVQIFQNYTGPVPNGGIVAALGLPPTGDDIAWPGIGVGYGENFPSNPDESNFSDIDRDNPKNAPNQSVSLGDNFSFNVGRHEMKVGFSVANTRVNTTEFSSPGGNYGFSGGFTSVQDPSSQLSDGVAAPHTGFGFADMFLGLVDLNYLNLVPEFHTRQTDYSTYVQDNWKITPRLTLNLGLRYEYWTPYTDSSGIQSTLNFNTPIPSVVTAGSTVSSVPGNVVAQYQALGVPFQTAAQAGFPSSLWNMPKDNLAPRVGFAYRVDEKSVVRGGYGIYYWTMPLVQYQQNTRHNIPFTLGNTNQTDNTNPLGAEVAYPVGPSTLASQSPGSRDWGQRFVNASDTVVSDPGGTGFAIAPWNPNYKAQRVQQYSLTLERELPAGWAASLGYVGNHGDHLANYDPINAEVPRALEPGATAPQRRQYPLYSTSSTGAMDLLSYIGYSNHNQMTAEVKHIFKRSFVFQSYFTWSQTLTTSEGQNKSFGGLELVPAALTNNASQAQRLRAIYARDSELPALNYGFNGHYELPFGQGKQFFAKTNGLVSRAITGWNVTAFYSWRNGLPFSPYYSANPNGTASIVLAPGKTGVLSKDKQTAAHWFDGSIYDPTTGLPYANQTYIRRSGTDLDFLSNITRSSMTGPHFYDMDGSLYKITPLSEKVFFDLELQVFNVFNHTSLALPNNLGVITSAVSTPRLLQFQGKITF